MTAARHDVEVDVLPDPAALAEDVARRLLAALAEVQAQGRVPSVLLTGGTIADRIHAALARLDGAPDPVAPAPVPRVDWGRVDLWWGDERFVPGDDPERNALQARRSLLDHVAVDPERVHEIPASDSGVDGVEDAADAYAAELRQRGPGVFDVVMLGVGPDGHVASLFPGHPQLDVTDRDAVAVRDSPKPPPQRVSLTFPALNQASQVWFLVSGEGKAEAVADALGGADLHDIPASGVTGRERTIWLLDSAAASRLPG